MAKILHSSLRLNFFSILFPLLLVLYRYGYWGRLLFSMEPTALHVWFDYEDVRCGARTRNPHREDQKLNPLPHATGVARLAQSVERKTLNLVVVGSSPTVGVCFCLGGLCHTHSRVVSTLHRHSLRELAPDYVSTCLVGGPLLSTVAATALISPGGCSQTESDKAASEENGALCAPPPPGGHGLYRQVVRLYRYTSRAVSRDPSECYGSVAFGVGIADFCVFS
ncbi:unnamed protein product [Peronospora farinosa]|uniref:Transmembrane protein n=1 Tax=Peronospora farinosa TaxID=134698 RepID=A0ABN8C3D4_9STRA|nr:unnamed protein product [Peronospora farinosa]